MVPGTISRPDDTLAPRQVALATPLLRGRVACVDLETTGGTAARHRITEVGIVLLEDGVVVDEWSSLVNPCQRIPPAIQAFTGITDEMVADAPTFDQLRADVRSRIEGRLFVAHNARFDYGFLRNEFRRLGGKFSAPVLCTVRLSRALFAEHGRHNLDTLIERWGLRCGQRHRALGDAAAWPSWWPCAASSLHPTRWRQSPAMSRPLTVGARHHCTCLNTCMATRATGGRP